MNKCILELTELKLGFIQDSNYLEVVRGINLNIDKGEIVGILGESGSGKSVSVKSIFGIYEEEIVVNSGEIMFNGSFLNTMSDKELTKIRFKEIAYIPQNPSDALNPYQTIFRQFSELGRIHKVDMSKEMIIKALMDVGIQNPETIMKMYSHQLSGGLAQRVVFAMSIILNPPLIIADEPTSSIDASLKKIVLELLKKINKEKGISIIVITHDFDVIKYIAERVYVMYGGLVLESGNLDDVINYSLHPYTKELIKCVKSIENLETRFYSMIGSPDNPKNYTNECPYISRCLNKIEKCQKEIPKMIDLNGRHVRCILYEEENNNEQYHGN